MGGAPSPLDRRGRGTHRGKNGLPATDPEGAAAGKGLVCRLGLQERAEMCSRDGECGIDDSRAGSHVILFTFVTVVDLRN